MPGISMRSCRIMPWRACLAHPSCTRLSRSAPRPTAPMFWQALRDAGRLRHLDGGGDGCFSKEDTADRRRLYHHLTFYGFLACFAATSVATVYHVLGRPAPYPWYDLPVLLGIAGGIDLLVGPVGLLHSKLAGEPALRNGRLLGVDTA